VRVRRAYSIVKPRTCSVAANFVGGSVDVKGIIRLDIVHLNKEQARCFSKPIEVKEGRHADD